MILTVMVMLVFICKWICVYQDLHFLTHSFPALRSSDLFQPCPVRPLITFTIRKTTASVAPVMFAKLRPGCGGLGSSRSSTSCIIAAVPLRQHQAASRCATRHTHARLPDSHST